MLPTVLYTLGTLSVGGTELRTLELFTALRGRYPDLRVTLYVTSGQPGPLAGDFASIGVDVVYGKGGVRGLPHFWRTCRRTRATLMHSNHALASGLHAMVAAAVGIRRRYAHLRTFGDDWRGPTGMIKRAVGRMLLRRFSTKVIGVADIIRDYASVSPDQWLTIYEGVQADGRGDGGGAVRQGPLTVMVLGRISPEKNYLRALAVAEALHAAGHDCVLRYVGPATVIDLARLRAAVAASPARDIVSIEGPSRAPLARLREADILLLPSCREGLPGAVLEALSLGRPVVASDLPGLREIGARVAGVTLLGLDESDMRWAKAVLSAVAVSDRAAIAAAFHAGPFRFDHHLDHFIDLWRLPRSTGDVAP